MQVEIKPGDSSRVHIALVNAFRAHWKAHSNKYPKKIIITQFQERALSGFINPKCDPPGSYWGVSIEIDPGTPGVMIAIDGEEMLLADYDSVKQK